MVVAQVQDLNVVVELEQVAELSRVLQAVQLVVRQVQLPQVHVHLQSGGCTRREAEIRIFFFCRISPSSDYTIPTTRWTLEISCDAGDEIIDVD